MTRKAFAVSAVVAAMLLGHVARGDDEVKPGKPEGTVDDIRDMAPPRWSYPLWAPRQITRMDLKQFEMGAGSKPPLLFFSEFDPASATRPATTAPTTAPATSPSASNVQTLIRQLGDDDPKVRNAATEALKKVGKDALPALKTATADDDPEVRTRAQSIVAAIENWEKASAANRAEVDPNLQRLGQLGVVRIAPGGALRIEAGVQMRVTVMNSNGVIVRDVNINEHGRQLHLREGADGIALEVTENGQTKSYQAKTAAELKEKEPEAFKDYEKCSLAGGGNGGGGIRVEVKP